MKLTRHFAHHQWGTHGAKKMVGNAALLPTLPGLICLRGKANFRNLSRYSDYPTREPVCNLFPNVLFVHRYLLPTETFRPAKGVANGKLYQVRATECQYLEGKLYLHKDLPAEWCKGLLLLVIRDALEGDLILGWGKGRGYGSFNLGIRLEKNLVSGWAGLKAYLRSRYNIQLGLAALHEQITL